MQTSRTFSRIVKSVAGAATAVGGLLTAVAARAQAGGYGPGFANTLDQNLQSTGVGIYGNVPTKKLPEIVGGVIQAALGLLGIVLVVIIIYAGVLWMTAAGNEEKVKKATGMIKNAVIGMVLIFAAYAITNFVVDALIRGTSG